MSNLISLLMIIVSIATAAAKKEDDDNDNKFEHTTATTLDMPTSESNSNSTDNGYETIPLDTDCAETDPKAYDQCTLKNPDLSGIGYIPLVGGSKAHSTHKQLQDQNDLTAQLQQVCTMFGEFDQCITDKHEQLNSGCGYPMEINLTCASNNALQPVLCEDKQTQADNFQCFLTLKSNGSLELAEKNCQDDPQIIEHAQRLALTNPEKTLVCNYSMLFDCIYATAAGLCGSDKGGAVFKNIDLVFHMNSMQIYSSVDSFACQKYIADNTPSNSNPKENTTLSNETKPKENETKKEGSRMSSYQIFTIIAVAMSTTRVMPQIY